ncbi:MAG: metal ABC transporter ATP-binding protein [bacterium]|nr:metal ABC transporter ATP-binding protein [bacterium]
MSIILEVKNLSVRFGKETVLENISFSVEEGEVFGIIGPNGAGKTTLFRAILGLIPYRGEIIWHKKARIGYVPQRLDFDKSLPLTGKELLLLRGSKGFWFPSEELSRDIKDMLAHVQAGHLENRSIGEMSGGELQRLLIAYALMGKPEVLLFDEPTSGIDLAGEATIYNLVKHLAQEYHLSVFFISHDINILYTFVDHVLCLNRNLLCSGAPKDVLTEDQLKRLYGQNIQLYEHKH